MAVQWVTIASLSGPAAKRLWDCVGQARKHESQEEEIPVPIWNRHLAPILNAIDRHAENPPIWSYHRSIDPWLMGDSFGIPFCVVPKRQCRVIYCHQGPESLHVAYRANWAQWLKQLGRLQRDLSKRNIGSDEEALLIQKLRDACKWCNVLAERLPAAVLLRRTCLRPSSGDEELTAVANQSPSWLAKISPC